jgi:hypothetical protein
MTENPISGPTSAIQHGRKRPRQNTQLFDAFISWMRSANTRLPVEVVISKRARDALHFQLKGYPEAFEGSLTAYDLTIAVRHEDTIWDLLFSVDCAWQPVEGGVVCTLCPPDNRELFSSDHDLWRRHWFASFERWIRGKLVKADRLALFGAADRASWAQLMTPGDQKDISDAIAVLPLPQLRENKPRKTRGEGKASREGHPHHRARSEKPR